jgi:hypothetical protein
MIRSMEPADAEAITRRRIRDNGIDGKLQQCPINQAALN